MVMLLTSELVVSVALEKCVKIRCGLFGNDSKNLFAFLRPKKLIPGIS